MNKLILMLLGLLLSCTALAAQVDKTLDADAQSRVSVSIIEGSIKVSAWDRDQVKVTGTVGDDVEKFIVERDGKEIHIKVKVPEHSWGRKDISADLSITVPGGSSIDIGTVSADIEVDGVEGEQELQSVSGDITTRAYASDIEAETVSGDVEIEAAVRDASAEWDLSSVSGDIDATGLSGGLEASVVSGDIRIQGGRFGRGKLETVNGDIRYQAGLDDGGKLAMESVNGDLEIRFSGEVSARFDIESFNGRINNCFGPKAERTSKYAPGLELNFTQGSGNGRVSLSTLNGRIDVCAD